MSKIGKIAAIISAIAIVPTLTLAQSDSGTMYANANASTSKHERQSTKTGTASSVSGTAITLAGNDGTTYTVDASGAKIVRKFGASMQLADIQNGDTLQVRGTVSGSDIIASLIRDMSEQSKNATFYGSVTAVNGSSFTLQSKDRGSQTVNTTVSTVFKKNGQTDANGMTDVTVGANVIVSGVWDSKNSNISATGVNIVLKTGTWTGKETSVSGTTLNFTGNNGTAYTVDASNAKVYRRFGATMQLSDIATGDTVSVRGTLNGTNITASSIRDLSQQQRNGTFSGKVTAVSGSGFTLQAGRGTETVNTSASTTFKKNGQTDANGMADVLVGGTVRVSGIWDSNANTIAASNVNVIVRMVGIYIKGTLSSVAGTTLTVAGSNSATYTVDASKARVTYKNGHKGDASILQANDSVAVYGRHQDGSDNVTAYLVRDLSQSFRASTTASSIMGNH